MGPATRRVSALRRQRSSPGESCYGLVLLAALAARAGSLGVKALAKAAATVEYESPRGHLRLHDRHLRQCVYLAEADGFEFDVLTRL